MGVIPIRMRCRLVNSFPNLPQVYGKKDSHPEMRLEVKKNLPDHWRWEGRLYNRELHRNVCGQTDLGIAENRLQAALVILSFCRADSSIHRQA